MKFLLQEKGGGVSKVHENKKYLLTSGSFF